MSYSVVDGYIDVDGDGTPNETTEDLSNLHGVAVIDGALDIDGNGVINTNDDGTFAGYTVINGRIDINNSGTVTTGDDGDLNGRYQFPYLAAGNYIVEIQSSNFNSGQPLYSQVQTYDQDSATVRDNQDAVALGANETYVLGDFGYTSSAIGDFVWQDSDGDGLWENGEVGIPGVVVNLYCDPDNTGDWETGTNVTLCGTATTDADGLYLFGGLTPNNYLVRVADSNFTTGVLQGYSLTADPNSYNNADPNAVPAEDPITISCLEDYVEECDGINWLRGITAPDSTFFPGLQLGQNDMGSDFGYQPPAIIGDFIWKDYNGDGVQDAGEPGIPNVDVFLCTSSSPCTTGSGDYIATATTNEKGYYYFSGRPAGTYVVSVDTSTLPTGYTTQTGDPEGNNDNSGNADTTGNVSDLSNDFGYTGSRLISGTIFFDKGTLGSIYQSGTDTPFSGVVVYLYDSTGTRVGSATTDSNGFYQFNVASGVYTVTVAETLSTKINGTTRVYEPDEATDDGYCGTGSLTCNNNVTVDVTSSNATNQDFGYFATMDMDDLPGSYNYNVLMQDEGPMHINTSGGPTPDIYLGTLWDAETDGLPDVGAGMNGGTTGDDRVGVDDEDGVVFTSGTWLPGTTAEIAVTVVDYDSTIGGNDPYLVAWFDWNLDGDFRDAGEQVVYGKLGTGTPALQVNVPSSAGTGLINMRFRLYATQSVPTALSPTGSAQGGEVEAYQINNTPTSVNLSSFDVVAQENAILLTWETASELDNLGFNVYRSDVADGPYTKLNATLIPVQNPGSTFGAVYTWLDANVQPGVTYYYKLEDVDVKGVATLNGPINVMLPADPTAVNVQGFVARSPMAFVALGLLLMTGALAVFRKRRA